MVSLQTRCRLRGLHSGRFRWTRRDVKLSGDISPGHTVFAPDTSEVTDRNNVIPDSLALIKAIISAKSRGESELSKLEVVVLLLLLKSQFFGFKRSELSAVGSGLLESKIVRGLLVFLVCLTSSGDSLLAENGENSSNSFSNRLYQKLDTEYGIYLLL